MQPNHQHKGAVAWFAANPVAANLLMLIILIAGGLSISNLRLEAFPSLPPSQVTVDVSFDSSSASAAEQGISLKIEQALQGLAGVKSITSISNGSGVSITIDRTSGYDLDRLYRDVKSRVDGVDNLPAKALKPVIKQAVFLENAVRIQLFGNAEHSALQQSAKELRRQLLLLPEISSIAYVGKRTPEVRIQLDMEKLKALDLTIQQVGQKIAAASTSASAGELFSEDGSLVVKAEEQRYWKRGFGQIVIQENVRGSRILLADIAKIDDSYRQQLNLVRFNNQNAMGLIVQLRENSDISEISDLVKQQGQQFAKQLPANIELLVWNDNSHYITSRLSLLMSNSVQGILLVMLLLSLFLNIRLAFWVGLGLPVIFCGAGLLMAPSAYNLTLNELTTFGFIMALGIVVDDAVVVGESIYTNREKHGENLNATITGAQRVTIPTVFGVLTTVVAFMSLTFVEGEMGQIFAHFAYAAAFCLIFSLIESKFILPAHLAHLKVKEKPVHRFNYIAKFWQFLQNAIKAGLSFFIKKSYRPLMHSVLEYRYSVLCCAIALLILVAGLVPSGKVRFVFFPDIPSDTLSVNIEFATDASPFVVQRQSLAIEQSAFELNNKLKQLFALDRDPIKNLMTTINGTTTTLVIELSNRSERSFNTNQLIDYWRDDIPFIEAVEKLSFISSFDDGADLDIELRAQDRAVLEQASAQITKTLALYSGVSGIKSSLKAGKAQYQLALKPHAVAMGFKLSELTLQVQNAIQGYEVQRIQRNSQEVKVMLRYLDSQRQNLYDLKHLSIRGDNGQWYSLSSLATITPQYVANEIIRADGSRVANITATLDKATTSAPLILAQLKKTELAALKSQFPSLQIKLRGEAENEEKTTQSLLAVFIIALLVIYALLAIPLKSYLQPLIIMVAIPFGIVGAILGHWIYSVPLSLLSLFGILALCGVVVNDSLLLMTSYNSLREQKLPPKLAVIKAASGRMRAIILTSTTTFFGLLPLISESSEQAQFLIPAAISMGYGILFATVITLIIIPVLILIVEQLQRLLAPRAILPQQLSESINDESHA